MRLHCWGFSKAGLRSEYIKSAILSCGGTTRPALYPVQLWSVEKPLLWVLQIHACYLASTELRKLHGLNQCHAAWGQSLHEASWPHLNPTHSLGRHAFRPALCPELLLCPVSLAGALSRAAQSWAGVAGLILLLVSAE